MFMLQASFILTLLPYVSTCIFKLNCKIYIKMWAVLVAANAALVRLNEAPFPVFFCVWSIKCYTNSNVLIVHFMSNALCNSDKKCACLPELYSRFNVLFIFLSHCKDSISAPYQTNTFRSFTQRRNLYLEEQRKVGVHYYLEIIWAVGQHSQ